MKVCWFVKNDYFCKPFGRVEFPLGINYLCKTTAVVFYRFQKLKKHSIQIFYQHV